MALRGSLLLLLLGLDLVSASSSCPSTIIALDSTSATQSLLLSSATPYSTAVTGATNLTSCFGASDGHMVYFTPPTTAEYALQLVGTATSAIEVRQGGACDGGSVVACTAGDKSVVVGWDALQLTAHQLYTIVISSSASTSSSSSKLWVGLSCAPTLAAVFPASSPRAVNVTLSSASSTTGAAACKDVPATTVQTMHTVRLFPPTTGLYSFFVRDFDGGLGPESSLREFKGFIQIVRGSCLANNHSAPMPVVYCSSSARYTLKTTAVFLNHTEEYTIRVGNIPYWNDVPVLLPDSKNVLEVQFLGAHGGGPDGTCLDYAVPAATTTYVLSPASMVYADLVCDGTRSYSAFKFGRYVAYTPKVTGDHYVRAYTWRPPAESSSAYSTPDYVVEVRANTCVGATVGCVAYAYSSSSSSYSTGINAVRLLSNTTYVILVGYKYSDVFPTYYTTAVEVGLVSAFRGESPLRCTNNGLLSTPHYQSTALSSHHHFVGYPSCEHSAERNGLYASYYVQFTGNYFVRVRNASVSLAVEVRAGSCGGASTGCSASPTTSSLFPTTGLDRVYLEAGAHYVIRVNAIDYDTSVQGNTLEVGYCGNMCAYTVGLAASNAPFGTVANVIQYNLATLVVPAAVFLLLGLVLGLGRCLQDGVAARTHQRHGGGGGVPFAEPVVQRTASCCSAISSLFAIHRLCVTCAVLAVAVWVSGWAVFWSVMAYPLSVLVCVRARSVARAVYKTERDFLASNIASESIQTLYLLVICGVLLLANAVVAMAQAGQQMAQGLAFCSEYYFDGVNQGCTTAMVINPVYGMMAAASMIVLGVCSIRLGHVVHSTTEAIRLEAIRSTYVGGATPQAMEVSTPAQPATRVTFSSISQPQLGVAVDAHEVGAAEEVDEDALCQICNDAKMSRTFYKCGHRTCSACADKIMHTTHKKCPFCNQPIKDVIAYF